MGRHLEKEIEKLKRKTLGLSALVEENVHKAIASVETADVRLADQVIDSDTRIDDMEVDVEEECLKILALHQPVAVDLRYIVGVLKLNSDLERIADLAVNMAEQARPLAAAGARGLPSKIREMARAVESMLGNSLDALVNLDTNAAWGVCAADDAVDSLHRETYSTIKNEVQKDPSKADILIHHLSVSRYLERIADHATNIAEDVIYLVDGDIVRHGRKRRVSRSGQ
ncbi:MAG TPA: phosphate signaling complex protein PhoU [Candidatus Binatia bacterium]|jgi:phosphate transport system protein|nr:phosphate signaling complex protein PhoU [Candidatus Binatia bacterium]